MASFPEESIDNQNQSIMIDHKRRYYPFTITWTSVPLITWLFPWAGHLGIGKSDGHVVDFGRPYKILTDSKQLGPPLKYWVLDPRKAKGGIQGWDKGIDEANVMMCKKMNFVLWNNCHTHVSKALNEMEFDGRTDWNETKLFWHFNRNFKYISCCTWLITWLPFFIIWGTVITLIALSAYQIHLMS